MPRRTTTDSNLIRKMKASLDFQENYERKVSEAASFLKKRCLIEQPEFGIILGSGLGRLAKEITGTKVIPYSEIPNFPQPTTTGHKGEMHIGRLEGVPIIGLSGRIHYNEVADEPFNTGILKVVFPVHVLAELGVRNYFATTAVGSLTKNYQIGDLMVIRSHIRNGIPDPLGGRHMALKRVDNSQRVERFQAVHDAYDEHFRALLHIAGFDPKHIHEGVYMASTGPAFETNAECIAFGRLGADVLGMSIAAEVIAARNRGMRVAAMAIITNKVEPDGTNAADDKEVKAILDSTEVRDRVSGTVRRFFSLYRNGA